MRYKALGILGLFLITLLFINSTEMNPNQTLQALISNKDALSLPKENSKIVKAVLEASQALKKNKSAEQQWRLLEKSRYHFNFLDKNTLFQQHWVDTSMLYADQHEGTPKAKMIQNHIYNFVTLNPKSFRSHQKLEALLFKMASTPGVHDVSKPKQKNPALSLLKKMDKLEKLTQHMSESFDALTSQLINGDFSDQSKAQLLIRRFEDIDEANAINLAKFYLPLAIAGDMQYIDDLKKISKAHLNEAQALLLSSKPETPYWFSGRWDQENLDQFKMFAPQIISHLENSIQAFKKNNAYQDPHINSFPLKKIAQY